MNNDQFVRYKALDRCFRDYYGRYTIMDLVDVCSKAVRDFHGDEDRSVARRTIEKDIEDLKLRYDIKLVDNIRIGHKKIYKYEDPSFSLMKKLLSDGELEQMLLQNVLDTLTLYEDVPHYKWLYMFLQQRANGIKADENQVIEFQNNPDLLGMEHFDELLSAILKHQPIQLEYKPYNKESIFVKLHPYLLKQYNDRWFLIGLTDRYSNLSNFAIDRILDVHSVDIPFQPAGVDLVEYFDEVVGVSRDEHKPIEDVLIRISRKRFPYIDSKPIHNSQTLIHELCDDENCVIRLRVQVSRELEAIILSLGSDAEVLSPASLRKEIKQKISVLYEKYSNSANDLQS